MPRKSHTCDTHKAIHVHTKKISAKCCSHTSYKLVTYTTNVSADSVFYI